MKRLCSPVLAVVLAASLAQAENWPQWRGPFLNGSTTETGLPATFSTTENVAWAAPMPGPSGSTPIVWDDRVFVSSTSSTNARSRGLLALCLSLKDGKTLWSRATGRDRRFARYNTMTSPSPIADAERVYFYYGTARLFAFTHEGEPLWERNLEEDYGYNALMFGYSSSPLLYQGRLYVIAIRNPRQDAYRRGPAKPADSYLLAIDPKTGKTLWKQTRPSDARRESPEAYTTALPYEHAGRAEVLVFGADYLTGHDPATGKELWRWAGYNLQKIDHWRVITSTVVADGLVYCVGPKHETMFAVRPKGSGRLGKECVAWTFDKAIPDASTPLVYQGRLYVLDDDHKVITCLEPATGKVHWQGRLGFRDVIRASLTGADGKLYIISEKGDVAVLAAGDAFKILHRTRMRTDGRDPIRSTIVAAQGRLLIRTSDKLYCIAQ